MNAHFQFNRRQSDNTQTTLLNLGLPSRDSFKELKRISGSRRDRMAQLRP
jgi:hypothetical protein